MLQYGMCIAAGEVSLCSAPPPGDYVYLCGVLCVDETKQMSLSPRPTMSSSLLIHLFVVTIFSFEDELDQ